MAEETLDRFDELSPRDVGVVQVDILQHSVHPLDLGSLLVLVLLDDHHLWVPLALLGIPTILEALEQAVLVPSQLDANLLELPAGDHSIFAVLLVLRIGQVLSAQSANAKLKPTNERKILPVIMPISSVLKISPAEVAVRVDEPGQHGDGYLADGDSQTSIKVESAWEPPQKCLGKRVFCNNHIAATKQRKLQQNGIKVA